MAMALTLLREAIAKLEGRLEKKSLVPWVFVTGCCRPEIESVQGSIYEWSRAGVLPAPARPELADVILVGGWINADFAEELKKIYSRISGPRSVVAIGACAMSGSPYAAGADQLVKVGDLLPVDVYVPGCPPRPEALLQALYQLRESRIPRKSQKEVLYDAIRTTP